MPTAIDSSERQSHTVTEVSISADVHFVNESSPVVDGVDISHELYTRLFPTPDEPESVSEGKYVLIRLLGAPDYFGNFNLYKISSINHYSPTPLAVSLVNQTNLARFNGQITLNKCIIRSVDPHSIPILEKVFVCVPENIYLVLQGMPLSSVKELFITKVLAHIGGIVRSGDVVRALNGTVKLCEPVSQGFLNDSTSIVLVKEHLLEDGEIDTEVQEEQLQESLKEIDLDLESDDGEDVGLDLSTYLNGPTVSNTPLIELLVKPLPDKLAIDDIQPSLWTKEDHDLFAFLNAEDFVRLGFPVFNGDSVKLSFGDKSVIIKILTVMEPNKSFRLGSIYLSPILIINLDLTQDSKITLSPIPQRGQLLSSVVPIAKSVTIARVLSPITMDKTYQQSFFAALKTSFHSSFKCVRQGDFIPVVIDTVLSKTMFDTNNMLQQNGHEPLEDSVVPIGDPDAVAWFRIVEISAGEEKDDLLRITETNQYVIDSLKTRMISSGVEHVRLPSNSFGQWFQFLQLPQAFPFYKVIQSNPLIFKYASELKKIICTCIESQGKVQLKTSILLNSSSRGLGKTTVMRDLALDLGLNLIELDCFDVINPGAELKTIGLLRGKIDKLIGDAIQGGSIDAATFHVIYLKHIENLCVKTDENEQGSNVTTSLSLKVVQLIQEYLNEYSNLVVVMSCNDEDKLSESLRLMVKFQIDFGVPNERERLEIFKFLIQDGISSSIKRVAEVTNDDNDYFDLSLVAYDKRNDVSYQSLALQSAGLTPRDLISIIKCAKRLAVQRLTETCHEQKLLLHQLVMVGNGGRITWIPEDFNKAINEARNQFSDSIGAPRIPNVKWEDIGGLDLVKDEILDTIDMPLKHPELFNNGLKKRSGILFYGPPGTGKTLLAKAIATNFSLNFFSVKGPELLNMYIGESEANVRRVFQKARDAKPCVIFFDELDSVAPKRGNQGDSGGVMDRIVSQLLAELDGMSGDGDGVFVVGATNRPDLLDEALLRPGRFDKMLYLGISDTNDKQAKILEALTRKFELNEDVDLQKIAEKCSFTFTGADFYALCSDSMLNAMTRTANNVDTKIKKFNEDLVAKGKPVVSTRWWFDNAATPEDIHVSVTMEDFQKAQNELSPSVSAEELEHYLRVRENFEGGKEKAMETAGGNNNSNGNVQNNGHAMSPELKQRVQELIGDDVEEIIDEHGNHLGNGYT